MFLINRGEIEGRLDTGFYKPETIKFIKWLASKSHTQKLKTFIKSMNTGFNNEQNENSHGLRFLRTQNVRPVYLDFEDATFTNDKTVQISKKGTLLFTRIGVNVGDVSFNNSEDFAISDNVICVDLKNETLAYYVAIFLSTEKGKILLEMQKRDTARPLISYENIKNLLIPILPIDAQKTIISIFENAYIQKQQKEAEAAALLASIDGYLLQELGITLPPPSEKKTYFLTRSNQVNGGRFDPNFYQPIFSQMIEKIKSGFFNTYHLRDVITFSTESWNGKDFFMEEFPYIEISEIDITFGEIKNINYIPINEAPSRAKMIVRNDDLIVSTTRPSRGAIAYINQSENELRIASTGFAVLRKSKIQINKYFLLFILKHKMTLMQMEQRSSGGNYPAITLDELGNILIPLPPLEKQTEIADHISAIRTLAKQLQQQAADELAHAKQQVEQLILGE